ncbi:MAG: hypothetical protein ACOX2L_07225 [Anaerolineae bacterium]|jgi:cytochrome b561|nr:hypothetical protein [Chloroflexota bacterium]
MKRRSYTKTQIAIWIISLLVVVSMLCGLIGSLFTQGPADTGLVLPLHPLLLFL